VQQLGEQAQVVDRYHLTQEVCHLNRAQHASTLLPWLARSRTSAWREMQRLAAGMQRDEPAISMALRVPWSQGQTEGQVNRLKMLKRQMYVRAGFAVLRRRMLGAS